VKQQPTCEGTNALSFAHETMGLRATFLQFCCRGPLEYRQCLVVSEQVNPVLNHAITQLIPVR